MREGCHEGFSGACAGQRGMCAGRACAGPGLCKEVGSLTQGLQELLLDLTALWQAANEAVHAHLQDSGAGPVGVHCWCDAVGCARQVPHPWQLVTDAA